MHSSNSTNTEAQLTMGWSGVNFTAGRMRDRDCSGLFHYTGHAYLVAGPLATTEGERERVLHVRNRIPDFSPISISSLCPPSSFSFAHSLLPCVSLPLSVFFNHEESRGD